MRSRYLRLVLALLTLASCFSAVRTLRSSQQIELLDENPVVLPAAGAIHERPFFSSRRNPAIAYDRQSDDVVGDLARRVEEGSVRLRFDKASGYLNSVLEALRVPVE